MQSKIFFFGGGGKNFAILQFFTKLFQLFCYLLAMGEARTGTKGVKSANVSPTQS